MYNSSISVSCFDWQKSESTQQGIPPRKKKVLKIKTNKQRPPYF